LEKKKEEEGEVILEKRGGGLKKTWSAFAKKRCY